MRKVSEKHVNVTLMELSLWMWFGLVCLFFTIGGGAKSLQIVCLRACVCVFHFKYSEHSL